MLGRVAIWLGNNHDEICCTLFCTKKTTFLFTPFMLQTFGAATTLGKLRASRRCYGEEKHLKGHHRPHYKEHERHHVVKASRLVIFPLLLLSSHPRPVLFHYLLLHPRPCSSPPFHFFSPPRVLAISTIVALTSISRWVASIRYKSLVGFGEFIEFLRISTIVWVKLFCK